jgi:hypothetical protein
MSKMNLPGFTADASLRKASERYRQQAGGIIPSNASIVPAYCWCAPCGAACVVCGCSPDPPEDIPFRFRGFM